MKWIRKHRMVVLIAGVALILLGIGATMARQQVLANSTETKLKDDPIQTKETVGTFYYDQLTEKEKKVYNQMEKRLTNLEGGLTEFEEVLNGTEYMRVTSALENEGNNSFYGFYDIPMTKDNVYVQHEERDLTRISELVISKGILFLSCAEGIAVAGEYAEDGKVTNLEQVAKGLSENTKEGLAQVKQTQEETEKILKEILDGRPADYGEKKTVDYFLNWLKENMTVATQLGDENGSFSGMGDVITKAYIYSSLSAVTMKQATSLGFAKILSYLCQSAGMESHVVLGKWGKTETSAEGYVLCEINMNGQNIYVDASGARGAEIAGQKYLTEKEAVNHMKFVEYFDYD